MLFQIDIKLGLEPNDIDFGLRVMLFQIDIKPNHVEYGHRVGLRVMLFQTDIKNLLKLFQLHSAV